MHIPWGWLPVPGCDSASHLFSVFALIPGESQLEIQASDQLEGGKALSMRRFLPAPPGLGGFEGVWETGLVGCVFLSRGPC